MSQREPLDLLQPKIKLEDMVLLLHQMRTAMVNLLLIYELRMTGFACWKIDSFRTSSRLIVETRSTPRIRQMRDIWRSNDKL
eukprot:595604-Amphidinium_carterae.1